MIKNIHFTGIKGVGMASLAVMAKQAGMNVTGSDVADQFITDTTLAHAGITPFVGFDATHVNDAELVVTTGAHGGYDNPEVVSAKEKGIRVVSLAEATGLVMSGELFGRKLTGISVAGTHGKTTTTAMIATVLQHNKLDPSYFIGTSEIQSLGSSGYYGNGEYFVVEADEYATEPVHDRRAKFLWQYPKIAVFTNIELDHPDIYPNVEALLDTFLTFANQLPEGSVVIACGDDHQVQKLRKEYNGRMITYGFSPTNDFVLTRVSSAVSHTFFSVSAYGTDMGQFMINVAGEHNCLNALAAIIVGIEAGLKPDDIKEGIKAFKGTKRRMECKGVLESGGTLYDDYGHHPTEIRKTLAALRSMFPKKRIICAFQPHTYSRTKVLFEEFTRAFVDADAVILLDIYASARENPDPTVSSYLLSEALKKTHKSVTFLPNVHDVVEYLDAQRFGPDSVIVTMGAGDVYKVAERLKFEAQNSKS